MKEYMEIKNDIHAQHGVMEFKGSEWAWTLWK